MSTEQQQDQRQEQRDNDRQGTLQAISDNDAAAIRTLVEIDVENVDASGLDGRTNALANIGALIALDADPASYIWQVDRAVENGATPDDVLGVLVACAPTVGVARMVAAAPHLAAALDIELDTDTESGNGSAGTSPGS
jgi:alkylhydroperoxidase/carboxymuconolactone decarboxylase family protein YurZ